MIHDIDARRYITQNQHTHRSLARPPHLKRKIQQQLSQTGLQTVETPFVTNMSSVQMDRTRPSGRRLLAGCHREANPDGDHFRREDVRRRSTSCRRHENARRGWQWWEWTFGVTYPSSRQLFSGSPLLVRVGLCDATTIGCTRCGDAMPKMSRSSCRSLPRKAQTRWTLRFVFFLILRRARGGGCPTYRIAVNADAFASGEHDETMGRSAARGHPIRLRKLVRMGVFGR